MKKYCSYHQGYHDADDFRILTRGRGGRMKIPICNPCYEDRKRGCLVKLEEKVAESKARNKRQFANIFHKNKKG